MKSETDSKRRQDAENIHGSMAEKVGRRVPGQCLSQDERYRLCLLKNSPYPKMAEKTLQQEALQTTISSFGRRFLSLKSRRF